KGAVLVSCALAADTRLECVSLEPSLSSGRLHLLSLVRRTRALQDCSDRVFAEPDMAADQPVAQTSLCQLEDLRRLAVRWTLSWVAAEPFYRGPWRRRWPPPENP